MQTGGLLALDLATKFGWVFGMPGASARYMEHGSVKLPAREGEGSVFAAYERWLVSALERWKPRLVVYEAPFLDQHRTSIDVATRLIGLGVITVKCCYQAKVYRVEKASNTAIKKFITGRGRSEKLDMIFAVRQYGFTPADDNAADALGLWLYSEARHAPQVKRTAGALFAA